MVSKIVIIKWQRQKHEGHLGLLISNKIKTIKVVWNGCGLSFFQNGFQNPESSFKQILIMQSCTERLQLICRIETAKSNCNFYGLST